MGTNCKLNVSVNDYTYPSPNKAIQQNKIELIDSKMMQGNKAKKTCNKSYVTKNINVSNDTTYVSCDNITTKIIIQKESTKGKLGVMALIAIMEPATES